ncbi:unnamed protein product, partial [Brachionus calyciflorus]
QCKIQEPINPRDALFGGRKNGVKLHHKFTGNEEKGYYDITSLYLFVQKYCNYLIGHPESSYRLVPSRINNKLVFPVCRTCAELQQNRCTHSVEEKCFEGT